MKGPRGNPEIEPRQRERKVKKAKDLERGEQLERVAKGLVSLRL